LLGSEDRPWRWFLLGFYLFDYVHDLCKVYRGAFRNSVAE
jgi:hypothetical protein